MQCLRNTVPIHNLKLIHDRFIHSQIEDFWELMKPRVMSLAIFTGAVSMYLAPHTLHPLQYFIALICLSVGAGAAGALNMWLEITTDKKMSRTRNRPLVRGVIEPAEAGTLGVTMSLFSVLLMGVSVNWLAAGWLMAAILFYIIVYTLFLKPRTTQNIVIGGVAGALPPVIGWAAVENSTAPAPWLLFLIIFCWTPSHFWTLSLWCAADYKKAGIPMLPNVSGALETRRQIGVYGAMVVLSSFLPLSVGMGGLVYVISAICLNSVWMWGCLRLYLYGDIKDQKRLFLLSILYLFVLFLMFAIDKAIYE